MKARFYFGLTIFVTAIALIVAWKKDPAFVSVPSPGTALVGALFSFFMASILIFSANVLLAIAKGKKAKTEEELEAIMVPAMRSEEYDDRIMRWTEVPRLVVSGVCLGVVLAFGVHYLIR